MSVISNGSLDLLKLNEWQFGVRWSSATEFFYRSFSKNGGFPKRQCMSFLLTLNMISMVSPRILRAWKCHCICHGLSVKDALQESFVNVYNKFKIF